MTVKELITKLQKFNPDLEVTITDGWECVCYHTKNIEIKEFQDNGVTEVDIGIGGCRTNGSAAC